MANLFVVPAFSTDVGARVEQATRKSLPETSWQLNMEIIDRVNSNPTAAKDFLRAIKKRLQSSKASQHEISLALVLLEAVCKNCGDRMRLLVSKKDFSRDVLYGVVSAKRGKQVCEQHIEDKVLLIIENVAINLEESGQQYDQSGQINHIILLRRELKSKGVQFPSERGIPESQIVDRNSVNQPKMGSVSSGGVVVNGNEGDWRDSMRGTGATAISNARPITSVINPIPPVYVMDNEPERDYIGSAPGTSSGPYIPPAGASDSTPGSSTHSTAVNVDKLKNEVKHVKTNVDMLNELIEQFDSPSHHLDSDEKTLLQDLADTCKEMQDRIVDLIPTITNEEFMIHLVNVNDEVLAVLKLHSEFLERKEKGGPSLGSKATTIYTTNTNNSPPQIKESEPSIVSDLIAFDDEPIAMTSNQIPTQQNQNQQVSVELKNDDPFGLGSIDFNSVHQQQQQSTMQAMTIPAASSLEANPQLLNGSALFETNPPYNYYKNQNVVSSGTVCSDFSSGSSFAPSPFVTRTGLGGAEPPGPGTSKLTTHSESYNIPITAPITAPSIPPRSNYSPPKYPTNVNNNNNNHNNNNTETAFDDWLTSQTFSKPELSNLHIGDGENTTTVDYNKPQNSQGFGQSLGNSNFDQFDFLSNNNKSNDNNKRENANNIDIDQINNTSNGNNQTNGPTKSHLNNSDDSTKNTSSVYNSNSNVNQRLNAEFGEFLTSSSDKT